MAIRFDDLRAAGPDDVPAAAGLLARAFGPEPFWRWAFPDEELRVGQLERLFALELRLAIPLGWTYLSPRADAVALWLPPGPAPDDRGGRVRLLRDLLGDGAERVVRVYAAEADSHPTEPHVHLSLVGVDPPRQRRGIGLGLVAACLERVDGEGLAARLTASNPVNVPRYERLGFAVDGEIPGLGGAPAIATLHRPARGA